MKSVKRFLASLVVVSLLFGFFPVLPGQAFAASLSDVHYALSGAFASSAIGPDSDLGSFTPITALSAGDTITLTFPAGTQLNAENILPTDLEIGEADATLTPPTAVNVIADPASLELTLDGASLSGSDDLVTIRLSASADGTEINHSNTTSFNANFSITTSVGDAGSDNGIVIQNQLNLVYLLNGADTDSFVAASTAILTFTPATPLQTGDSITLYFPGQTNLNAGASAASDFLIAETDGTPAPPQSVVVDAQSTQIELVLAASSLNGGDGQITIGTSGAAAGDEIQHPHDPTSTGVFGVETSGGDLQLLYDVKIVSAPPPGGDPGGSSVVINEVMWMGSSLGSADEWIELFNNSGDSVDLTSWSLAGAGSVDLPLSGTIAANSYLVLANFIEANSQLLSAPDITNGDLDLVDSANGDITLKNAGDTVVDTAPGDPNWAAGSYTLDTEWNSMQRIDTMTSGVDAMNWCTASESLNFKLGATEQGSPGAANNCGGGDPGPGDPGPGDGPPPGNRNLSGQIVLPGGSALPAQEDFSGIALSLQSPPDNPMANCYGGEQSSPDGSFTINLDDALTDSCLLLIQSVPSNIAYAPGAGVLVDLSVQDDVTTDDLELATVFVQGEIRTPDGQTPVANAQIQIHNNTWTVQGHANSGSDGTFKFAAGVSTGTLQSGTNYTLEISPPWDDQNGYGANQQSFKAGTTCTVAAPCLINLTDINVSGLIKTPLGSVSVSNPEPDTAVPNASVNLHDAGYSFSRWGNTDQSGTYAFGGVPAGEYILEIERPWPDPENPSPFSGYSRTSLQVKLTTESGSCGNYIDGVDCFISAQSDWDLGTLRFSLPNIIGRVTAPSTGDPIFNAWVNVNSEGPGQQNFWTNTSTDQNGVFSLFISATGTYRIMAEAPDGSDFSSSLPGIFTIEALTDQTITISSIDFPSWAEAAPYDLGDIPLTVSNVSGTVLGPEGISDSPVPSSNVEFFSCPDNTGLNCHEWITSTMTDNSGDFAASLLDGTYKLEVRPPWGMSVWTSASYLIQIQSDIVSIKTAGSWIEQNPLTLRLGTPNLSGVLKTPVGASELNPFPDALVADASIMIHAPNNMGPGGFWGNGQTNEEGAFGFSDIQAGVYEVEIMPPWSGDFSAYTRTQFQIKLVTAIQDCGDFIEGETCFVGDNVWDLGTLRFSLPNVFGKVTRPDNGNGVGYASINLHTYNQGPMNGGGIWRYSEANVNGNFSFNVPDGTYQLEVQPPYGVSSLVAFSRKNYLVQVENGTLLVEQGEAFVEPDGIALFPLAAASVFGTVVDDDGTPVRDAWIDLHSGFNGAGANSLQGGAFSVGGLADGIYQLSMNAPWGRGGMIDPGTYYVVITDQVGTIYEDTGDIGIHDDDEVVETIAFVAPAKTLTVTITAAGTGNPVTDAMVFAHREGGGGFVQTNQNEGGVYTLLLGAGKWSIMMNPDFSSGADPNWVYSGAPKSVKYTLAPDAPESKNVSFEVAPTNATITGTVVDDGGDALSNTWVDVRNQKGQGNGAITNNLGVFTVKVTAGTYNISVWPSDPTLSSPALDPVTVTASGSTNVGTVQLVAKNSHIKGYVLDSSQTGIANTWVSAWRIGGMGWADASTDESGLFDLTVGAGTWELMIFTSSDDYLYTGNPIRVTIADGQTSLNNNFNLLTADATIKGKLVHRDCSESPCVDTPITGAYGTAWVSEFNLGGFRAGGDDSIGGEDEPMSKGASDLEGGWINSGTFTLKLPAGDYNLGAMLYPGSGYTPTGTTAVTAVSGQTTSVQVFVVPNNASISGQFVDESGDPVSGLHGEVSASNSSGGWQTASIEDDGSFSLNVAAGSWTVDAWLDTWGGSYVVSDLLDGALQPVASPTLTLAANTTITRHFRVLMRDHTINGSVLDPDGNPLGNVWVFARPEEGTEIGMLTGSDGTFSLQVAAGDYTVGAGLPPWIDSNYINPPTESIPADDFEGGVVDGIALQFSEANATVSGTVWIDANANSEIDGGEESEAYVRAWNNSGGYAEQYTSDGSYTLNISEGDTWFVEAVIERYANSQWTFYRSAKTKLTNTEAATTLNPKLLKRNGISKATSVTFDASQSTTIRIKEDPNDLASRETVLFVPAGAIETSGQITIVATPKAQLPSQAGAVPVRLGFNFDAMDSQGRAITRTFSQNVSITFPYDDVNDDGYIDGTSFHEDDIDGAYFDTTTNTWRDFESLTVDKEENTITGTTNHFTDFAVISTGDTVGPRLLGINWSDVNLDGLLGTGDEVVFDFSEEMLNTTITDANVNARLAGNSGGTYGSFPTVAWNSPADTGVTVTLGANPTIATSESVNPTDAVTDASGLADTTPSAVKVDTASPTRYSAGSLFFTEGLGMAAETLTITFNEAIGEAGNAGTDYTLLYDEDGNLGTGDDQHTISASSTTIDSVDQRRVHLSLGDLSAASYASSTGRFHGAVSANVLDLAGNGLSQAGESNQVTSAVVSSFDTREEGDETPDTPTQLGFAINNDASYTNERQVTLSLSASGAGSIQVRIASDDNFAGVDWIEYEAEKSWILPAQDGSQTVYAEFRQQIGDNVSEISQTLSDSIILDTTLPTGTIAINNGEATTSERAVTLNLTATDANSVSAMRFANGGGPYSSAVDYATSKSWQLSSGDGIKTVYVQFRDVAGNWSAPILDAIQLTVDTNEEEEKVKEKEETPAAPLLVSIQRNADGNIVYTVSSALSDQAPSEYIAVTDSGSDESSTGRLFDFFIDTAVASEDNQSDDTVLTASTDGQEVWWTNYAKPAGIAVMLILFVFFNIAYRARKQQEKA